MTIVRSLMVLLAAALAASGAYARTAPIQNLEDLPIVSADGKPLTVEQVKNAIISGGARARWTASLQPGNVVRLTYSPRSHVAVVNVTYNAKTYSIRYADSTNLNYAPEGTKGDGVIHPNYNKWVQNLRQAIEVSLRSSN
jgi:hypothetical protein